MRPLRDRTGEDVNDARIQQALEQAIAASFATAVARPNIPNVNASWPAYPVEQKVEQVVAIPIREWTALLSAMTVLEDA